MEQKSMTALVSAFSRAYHSENNEVKIFDDNLARALLTNEEYTQISNDMSDGIRFFNPGFTGSQASALRWIVDNQLSPPPLGRAAFAEKALQKAVLQGTRQYLILGAGYDTFAYRQPDWAGNLQIFEVDHPATANDKKLRLDAGGIAIPENVHYVAADFTEEQWRNALVKSTAFHNNKMSFCSILGVAYYLSKQSFEMLISILSSLLPMGSSIAFDYPDENTYTHKAGERAKKQAMLASSANEKMLASYSHSEIEKLFSNYGFLTDEHLTPSEMTEQYFTHYNYANPRHPITGFDNVNYCLMTKKQA